MRFKRAKIRRKLSSLKGMVVFLKGVVNEFLSDNCPHLAASISYYLLFSIFPLTLGFVSVLGFISQAPETEARVIDAIGGFLPVSSEYITDSIGRVVSSRGATGAFATLGLLWGGSSVFNAIRKSLNTAWGVRKPRPFLTERLVEFGMMLGAGIVLVLSFSVTTALNVIRTYSLDVVGAHFFNGDIFWNLILVLLTTGMAFGTFLVLYKVIPNTHVRWSDVWAGALLAAVGFEATKQIFVWYATSYAHYDIIYGPLSTVIALMVWTYVSAIILLFCAKLTSVYSRSRRSFEGYVTLKSGHKVSNGIQSYGRITRLVATNTKSVTALPNLRNPRSSRRISNGIQSFGKITQSYRGSNYGHDMTIGYSRYFR